MIVKSKTIFNISVVTLLILVFSLSFMGLCVDKVFAQNEEADLKLQETNVAVGQAYFFVLEAEGAGANVEGLVNKLNEAVNWFAEAQVAYRVNDFNTSFVKSDLAFSLAQEVSDLAQSASSEALISAKDSFFITVGLSLGGCVGFIVVLFFVWLWIKKKYFSNLLGSTPEVYKQ